MEVVTIGSEEYSAKTQDLARQIKKNELQFQETNNPQYAVNVSTLLLEFAALVRDNGFVRAATKNFNDAQDWLETAEMAAHEAYSRVFWNKKLEGIEF